MTLRPVANVACSELTQGSISYAFIAITTVFRNTTWHSEKGVRLSLVHPLSHTKLG